MWHAVRDKFVYLNGVSAVQRPLCMDAGNTKNIKLLEITATGKGGDVG